MNIKTVTQKIEQILEHLKQGRPIIVTDDENRENEGDLITSAATITPDTLNLMIQEACGLVCAPISEEIAHQLELPQMVAHNTDHHRTAFTISVDETNQTTTGISVADRLHTLHTLANPESKPRDFRRPGHIFPLVARQNGLFERQGHTEATIELLKLAELPQVGVICEILNKDGTMARHPQLTTLGETHNIPLITIKEITFYLKNLSDFVVKEIETHLPTDYGTFTMISFNNKEDQQEHFALVCGDPAQYKETPLVRLHSECLTGDLLASHRCDCGSQLHKAMETISEKGEGIILYLRQEGRGIGLFNKMKAYELQDQGLDTVDANLKLGYNVDMRDYGIAAGILKQLNITKINLMTNNPDKIQGLQTYGITIENRIEHEVPSNTTNRHYLETKKNRMGHLLKTV